MGLCSLLKTAKKEPSSFCLLSEFGVLAKHFAISVPRLRKPSRHFKIEAHFAICSPSPWQSHPQTSALWTLVRWIKANEPLSGVLENVGGFLQGPSSEKTPLQTLEAELLPSYAVQHVQLNLSTWHAAERHRHLLYLNKHPAKTHNPQPRRRM